MFQLRNPSGAVGNIVFQHGGFAVGFGGTLFQFRGMAHHLVALGGEFVTVVEFALNVRFDLFDFFVDFFLLRTCQCFFIVPVPQPLCRIAQRGQPESDFHALFLFHQDKVLLGFLRFTAQGFHAPFQFRQNHVEMHQIFLGAGKIALRLLLAVAVFGNARRFFKDTAPFLGTHVDHVRHFALSDNGIAVTTHAGVHKEFVDILETNRLAVDFIFTVARTVVSPGNRDFVAVKIQRPVAVVNGQHHFRETECLALGGAAENHVLHRLDAQDTGCLFPQYPAHRVADVALAAAVGSDSRCNTGYKRHLHLVGKRFEPHHVKRF